MAWKTRKEQKLDLGDLSCHRMQIARALCTALTHTVINNHISDNKVWKIIILQCPCYAIRAYCSQGFWRAWSPRSKKMTQCLSQHRPNTNLPTQGAGQGEGRGQAGLAMGWPYQLCQDRQEDDDSGSVAGKLCEQGNDNRDEDDSHGRWHTLQGVQTASYPHRQARLLQKGRGKTAVILLHPCRELVLS